MPDPATTQPASEAARTQTEPYKSVLVIDDDEGIRESLVIFFEIEGYDVVGAANGQEGFESLTKMPRPCLIILDLMMPVVNGWEFVHLLENTRYADIPIVLVTAYDDQVGSLRHDDLLKKPIDLSTLEQTLKKWCGGPRRAPT